MDARLVEVFFARPFRLTLQSDAWIACLGGTAWLTRDGRLEDTILEPGDLARVSAAEKPLIVGMPRCLVRVSSVTVRRAQTSGGA